MKDSTKDILYKIDRSCTVALSVMSAVVIVLLVLAAFNPFLKIAFFVSWAIWGLVLITKFCLMPFVKSEEEEEFENKVKYILEQKRLMGVETAYTPLRDVTPEQEQKIKQFLHDLPEHAEKPGQINLALIAQYLTALEKLGKADLKDKRQLRLWIAEVTEKKVPSPSQFNEAIPSTASTKVSAARKEWEAILQ